MMTVDINIWFTVRLQEFHGLNLGNRADRA